ncbi:MAG TPA: winged helix-turn-helix domain-containing protein [Terriglobia bacterium]|nr:winged helix-turn-helix domain-containing protein [Terriglobia bacterium]
MAEVMSIGSAFRQRRILNRRERAYAAESTAVVRFAEFQADLQTGELFRGKQKIRLQEKPFQILRALIECPGQMVSNEELRRRLWSNNVFVDFDRGLKTAISKLRRALGDSAAHPRLVETLPRRGYRFVAPLAMPREFHSAAVAPRPDRIKLAVLPFDTLSAAPGLDYFSDGMTQEIIFHLARLHPRRLGVIARTSAMRYKHAGKTVEQIGRELGVDHVLEGSVRREAKRVRITVQLIQVGDQTPLWLEMYDEEFRDLLALQTHVAGSIAREIKSNLTLPD